MNSTQPNIKPTLKVFKQEIVQNILDEGLLLLKDPGVRVDNRQAREILAQTGADVDQESKFVTLPEELVWKAVESAPSGFDLFDVHKKNVVQYQGDAVHFDPGSTALTILDGENGDQRPPVTADMIKFVKLVECLPQLDAQSTAMICSDVPKEIGDLYRLYLALNFMSKPIITGAFRKDTWEVMKDLLVAIRGDRAALSAYPLAVFDVCPSPPLMWSDLTCQNLIDCARWDIPVELVSMPLAGATAPVTLAGAIVQHCAESLSGIVIHQLTKPGAPIVWGGSPGAFDMRTGAAPMGAAETWLIDAGYIQVGKSLGLPTHTYSGMSESKLLDSQSGLESMGGAMIAALSGANMISGAGMLDFETCQSFEKLVIDAEVIGLVRRVLSGIAIRETPIALDVFQQVSQDFEFLKSRHTHRWFREELSFPSDVIDRGGLEAWIQAGRPSTFQRANQRVDQLLRAYTPPEIPPETRRELRAITAGAARKFGMDRLPPLPEYGQS
jgi:trimethylamine--corrinoid protein Co-methyltransferase